MRKPTVRKTVFGVSLYLAVMTGLALLAGTVSLILVLGPKLVGFNGISRQQVSSATVNVSPDLIEQARAAVGDDVLNALDCSNLPPSQRIPGRNCIEGLLARASDSASPVPDRAAFMLPVWQAAAKKYSLPWELLAAVEGARSNFGWINCETSQGNGAYRTYPGPARKYTTDGGSMFVKKDGPECFEAVPPGSAPPVHGTKKEKKASKARYQVNLKKVRPLASLKQDRRSASNVYDPVDATFTTAAMLAHNGAFKNPEWNYSGSGPGECSVAPVDGRVWYVPFMDLGYGPGAKIGFNKRLDIPKKAALIAAKWRSDKGNLKPRRADSALDRRLKTVPMPEKTAKYLLRVAWYAFGVRGEELTYNVNANYKQAYTETGTTGGVRPYIMQSVHLDWDGNDDNPAGGLFGFIQSTFEHWKVDGFDDRFNPLDSILGAVNAQVNGPYKIMSGGIGWSPPWSHNPYATGGRSRLVGDKETVGRLPKKPYKGKAQTDPISKAVRYQSPGYPASDCYVAVIHDWYRQIKAHPPAETIDGPIRQRIVKIAQAELKKGVAESGGDNVPRYLKTGDIAVYNISNAWCQAFASRIWYWAGLKKITMEMGRIGGMSQMDGKVMPSFTGTPPIWAQPKNLYKTDNPMPGDMAFYGTTHVEIVEKVQNGQVLSTIGGNTSDAVTRRMAPSGITHFISPPASSGASSYNLGSAENPEKIGLNGFAESLNVRAGVITTTGKRTQGEGKIQSTYTFDQIGIPVAIATVRQAGSYEKLITKNAVNAALRGSRAATSRLIDRLGRKSDRKIEKVFRRSGDSLTGVADNPFRTIWTGEASNRMMLALSDGRLTDRKSAKRILEILGKNGVIKIDGTGNDYNKRPKRIYRATTVKGKTATTVFVQPTGKVNLRKAADRILRK